ncbi:MAG: carboxyltransferase domain-containing protein, partial [Actinomycetota bacterium]
MEANSYKIFPLGTDALTIEFGHEISIELNDKTINLFHYFEANPFTGLIETIPAYCSFTIFYDVLTVRKRFHEFLTAFEAVKNLAEFALLNLAEWPVGKPRLIEIPVNFSQEFAPDLEFVAS